MAPSRPPSESTTTPTGNTYDKSSGSVSVPDSSGFFSSRSMRQSGLFIVGAGFLAGSVFVTRRAIARRQLATAMTGFHSATPPPSVSRMANRGVGIGNAIGTGSGPAARVGASKTTIITSTPVHSTRSDGALSSSASPHSIPLPTASSPSTLPPTQHHETTSPPSSPTAAPAASTPVLPNPEQPAGSSTDNGDGKTGWRNEGSFMAVEALNLATLNIMAFAVMFTGGLAWAFDISSVEELRERARARMYGAGVPQDADADRDVEEWAAKVLLRMGAVGQESVERVAREQKSGAGDADKKVK